MTRAERVNQFKTGTVPVHIPFYPSLVVCAFSELSLALDDRRYNVRFKNNHYSQHAIGSIVLLVTAFESYLNNEILTLGFFDKDIRELANVSPPSKKYYEIIKKLEGTIQQNNDLYLIIELRNEIVHFLPRTISKKDFDPMRYIPKEFYALDKKGLFFGSEGPGSSPLGLMICSYRLAYWVWENIDIAVNNFVRAFSTTNRPDHINHSSQYRIFDMYQQITSPDNLANYDDLYELELTK